MSLDKFEILRQIRTLFAYHTCSGISVYPRSSSVMDFLRSEVTWLPEKGEEAVDLEKTTISPKKSNESHAVGATVLEIAEEVRICHSCDLHRQRIIAVPGRGGHRVKLFIVGGWLTLNSTEAYGEPVFGEEEDGMIAKMLAAIHLKPEDAFLSNIIKCGIHSTVQPRAENIAACTSYLERQIVATQPQIICTMGRAATRALLNYSQSLSQLRGRFHQYEIGDGRSIPLMPTYHPSFLIKNPEMKKATWADLQSIEKKLNGK